MISIIQRCILIFYLIFNLINIISFFKNLKIRSFLSANSFIFNDKFSIAFERFHHTHTYTNIIFIHTKIAINLSNLSSWLVHRTWEDLSKPVQNTVYFSQDLANGKTLVYISCMMNCKLIFDEMLHTYVYFGHKRTYLAIHLCYSDVNGSQS